MDDIDRRAANGFGSTFWRLWRSASLSGLADGSFKVALPLVARTLTDSPALIAGIAFTATLPWLVIALPAGAFVDRADRRKVMLAANIVRASVLSVFAVLTAVGLESIAMLFVLAFAVGTAETLYETSAQAIVPAIVARPLLARANAWQQVSDQVANQFLGPAMGGALVGLGVALTFTTSAGLWFVSIGALLLIRGDFRPRTGATDSLGRAVRDGLKFLWSSTILRSIALCAGITNFAGSAASAVFVVYAVGPGSALGLSSTEYGLLLTASAGGSVLGAAAASRVRSLIGLRGALALNIVTQAVQIAVPLLSHGPAAVATGFVIGGVGVAVWNVVAVSLRQQIAPADMLGRITSSHRLVSWGALSLGALSGGILAQLSSVRLVFVVMAVLTLTALLVAPAWSEANLSRESRAPAVATTD